ncbi:MAG: MBL fold metallo-hydrolase, partial [Ginsengibacter sp.]
AFIIDPLREIEPYLDRLRRDKVTLKYIFETHFHADFVSGHLDLSKKTGAPIVYGPGANPDFEAHIATDGEIFRVGKVHFKVLHTPGHTMESVCYLLADENGKDVALFSGDTLFIGDVGRPDLAQKATDMTKEELAATLFDSLRNKVMPLNDDIIVYPAHGAGSACGKNMSKETSDTLGHQKKVNYALRSDMTKDEFVKEVTAGLMPPPAYFPLNVMLNKHGYESIDDIMERGNIALSPGAFEEAANDTGALILDTRDAKQFADGFIPNSINIGIDGNFAPWVGVLITDIRQEILIVAENGREEEVITRLARVGYDHTIGFLEGGIDAWKAAGKETDTIKSIRANELASVLKKNRNEILLDVRKPDEYLSEHVMNAESAPLDFINESMLKVSKNSNNYLHCASGYRSMIFASILKSRGYDNVINVSGGFNEIKEEAEIPVTNFVCPTTLV